MGLAFAAPWAMGLLLSLILLADPISSVELNFSLEPPLGWEQAKSEPNVVYLHNGDATAQLFIVDAKKRDLDALVDWWRGPMEQLAPKPDKRNVTHGKLADEPCVVVDLVQANVRITWLVARRGTLAYGLWLRRTTDADDADDVEEDLDRLRASFKFLRAAPAPDKAPVGEPPKPGTPEAKPEPAKELKFPFWRFTCLKPKGLTQLPPKKFDDYEKGAGVVARFDAIGEQTRLMIRVHAHRQPHKLVLKLIGEQRLKEFEQRYPVRKEPEIDRKWSVPGAKECLHLRLVGKRVTKVVEDWYFVEHRNGCFYQIQVYRSGASDWKEPVAEFLKNFKPATKG